ncbi:MAG TPA: hypothetical protein VI072_30610 [Polyangiaceae bacterium]
MRQVTHDEAGIKPKHSIAETLKLCVAALVGAPPLRVIPAIHFDDEANTGREEIDGEAMAEWHLPAELHPELAARESRPEPTFRIRELGAVAMRVLPK